MQNKQQMLASTRARATYAKFQQQRVGATICRGTSGNDFNFFYSDHSYWADNCLGWVIDDSKKSKICAFCFGTPHQKIELQSKIDNNEIRKEPRDGSGVPGPSLKSDKSNGRKLQQLRKISKCGGSSNKDVSNSKIKKAKKTKVQKTKKRDRK